MVIVDADALIALSNTSDTHHEKAKHILHSLLTKNAAALFPATVMCEAVTVLRGRLNNPVDAGSIIKKLLNSEFPVQAVDEALLKTAASLYRPEASKKNTLFDAVVASVAKRQEADAIFSFDGWYRKLGFQLASNVLEVKRAA